MTLRKTFFRRYISLISALIFFIVALSALEVKAEGLHIVVTIDHKRIDADLADFPVMLELNDCNAQDFMDRIVSHPQNCLKFKMLDSQGRQLYVEKELWNAVDRKVILHVKVPYVSAFEDTVIRLYYDESMLDNTTFVGDIGSLPAQQVWDHNFVGVWHMADADAATIKDSTANLNHGTKGSAENPYETESIIGPGQAFDASSERINIGDIDIDASGSIEAIAKIDDMSMQRNIAGKMNKGGGTGYSDLRLRVNGGNLEIVTGDRSDYQVFAADDLIVEADCWYYLAARADSQKLTAVLNQTHQQTPVVVHPAGNSHNFNIGNIAYYKYGWNGVIGEVRISNIARSDAWLKASYHSLLNTLIIYSLGPDTDGDGIADVDEINIYGTDPNLADTDGDNINDGDELLFWGDNWDADADCDGTINLLDADSDNDGFLDGDEIDQGADPADAASCPLPGPKYQDVDYGLAADEQLGGAGLIGDSVRILNGNAVDARSDLRFSSPHQLGLGFEAFYNSQSYVSAELGYGWSHTYCAFLKPRVIISGRQYLKIVDGSGRARYFTSKAGRIYEGAYAEKSCVKNEGTGFVWYRLDGLRYGFSYAGKLIWLDDQNANRLAVEYDGQNRLQTVVDLAGGRMLSFHFNANDLLAYISGPATAAVPDGIRVTYGYDHNRNLTSVNYADESGFSYSYDDPEDVHNLTQKKDNADHLIATWSYDEQDRCDEHFDSQGKTVAIDYVNETRVNVIDAYGVLRSYRIGNFYRRKRVYGMRGKAGAPYADHNMIRWTYDKNLNLSVVVNASRTAISYQDYDDRGNPQTVKYAWYTPQARIVTYTYHPGLNVPLTRTEPSVLGSGNKVTIWDYDNDDGTSRPNGNPTALLYRIIEQGYTLDKEGKVMPYRYVTNFQYNDKGQIRLIDGPRPGAVDITRFEYDPTTANLNKIIQPRIGETTFYETAYDDAGQVGQMVDVNGRSTCFEYDARGRVTKIIYDADGSSKSAFYVAGFLDTIIDEDGVESGYEYDPEFGRLYRIYDPQDNYIEFVYDDQGNLQQKSKHDPSGQRFFYKRWRYNGPDIPGKLWKQINYNDSYTQYRYDANGNLKSKTDPQGRTTEYGYDSLNRLITVTQTHQIPGDAITSYTYDAHDNLQSITDAQGQVTAYTYDDMGRVVSTESADIGTTTYAYDEAGNLIGKTDANLVTVDYAYDELNRLTTINFPDASQDITYFYDETVNGIGLRTAMIDPSGATTFGYDTRGRWVSKINTVNGFTYALTRKFTPGGRYKSIRYPSGRRIFHDMYENTKKLKSMWTVVNKKRENLISEISYKPFGGTLAMRTGSNGNVYNQSGACNCLEYSNPGTLMEQVYTYDDDHNVEGITGTYSPWLNQNFFYDSMGRLEHAAGAYKSIDYTYDKVGNRLTRTIDDRTQTYTYYPGTNRLESFSGATTSNYRYDDNGNSIEIGNMHLNYNHNNRLTQVIEEGIILANYTYNGLGQRITKDVGADVTVFHYDFAGNIIAESLSDGTITSEYLYSGSNRLAKVDIHLDHEQIYYYLNNYLGTPTLMTDNTGTVVWEAIYKPFGEVEISPHSDVVNNFRFAGQYYDQETGLHYNYHRYYDPKTGRYLTPDPIGLMGVINLFVYAANNPANLIDPWGLKEWTIHRYGAGLSLVIVGLTGQRLRFISNCENNQRTVKTYLVFGLGLNVGLEAHAFGGVDEEDQSKGYLGSTTIKDDPNPKWGMAVSGPSAGIIVTGGTLASAQLDFKNNYSEIYGATTGKFLGISIFNAEGQRYFYLGEHVERCCENEN